MTSEVFYPHWKKNEIIRPASLGYYWIILTIIFVWFVASLFVPASAANSYAITGSGWFTESTELINLYGIGTTAYQADADEKLLEIQFDLPIGTVVNFTLTYGTGTTITGYAVYESAALFGVSTSKIQLGADENSYSENFLDAQVAGIALTKHIQLTGYARNTTDANNEQYGFAFHAPLYGINSNEIVFYPVTNLQNNLISGVSVTASQPIDFHVTTAKTEELGEAVSRTLLERVGDGFQNIMDIASSVKDIALSVFYWLKFLFVDNIILTFALYFSVTMAYSAMTCVGNIFCFYKKFFRLQKTMIEFMINTVGTVVRVLRDIIPI